MDNIRISRFLVAQNPMLQSSKKHIDKDNLFILHSIYPECLIRIRYNARSDTFSPFRDFVLVQHGENKNIILDVIRNYDNATDQQLIDTLQFAEKWLIKFTLYHK